MPHDIHAGLARYLASRQVADLGPDDEGTIVLNLDSALRIHCRPLAQGELLLDARLVGLPANTVEREAMIMSAMQLAVARLHDHPDVLVMPENGRSLRLQRRAGADASSIEIEACLGEFADAMEVWRGHFGRG